MEPQQITSFTEFWHQCCSNNENLAVARNGRNTVEIGDKGIKFAKTDLDTVKVSPLASITDTVPIPVFV